MLRLRSEATHPTRQPPPTGRPGRGGLGRLPHQHPPGRPVPPPTPPLRQNRRQESRRHRGLHHPDHRLHLITSEATYTDLGVDYYTHREDPDARKNRLLRQLHELGYHAELTPAA